ncbi:hypothetical protein Apa02nite_063930 [Actinoplanes palleronii]|uniref:Uncharacterized protein n=1 Tax=Actinoplanes palleronii TaxID=113570 RepID=A0ABQ4BJ38_9ACTN|nr:hypothetical protein Apa02nite_063930 [Actinoplanes palleronii]
MVTGTRRFLTPDDVDRLYARAAGLLSSGRGDAPDASTLVIRIRTASGWHETSVRGDGDRGRADEFMAAATRAGTDAGAYRSERVAVVVVADSDGGSDVRPWPLSTPATGMPGYPSRPCLVTDAAAVLAAVRTATVDTRWTTDDGHRVALRVRPLLAYEKSCIDLGS